MKNQPPSQPHNSFNVSGKIIDIINKRIFPGTITINNGLISSIKEEPVDSTHYILPGFVDAHVHIESSMLPPSEFGRWALVHGTVATVSDPHEIANVLGTDGIRFMFESSKKTPLNINLGAPPCVPATIFETAGADISASDIRELLESNVAGYVAEVMNWPGVLAKNPELLKKVSIGKKLLKPVDGHAPGVRGNDAKAYIAAGISTDHECTSYEEAYERISLGMKILIREGSAAKNFSALIGLLHDNPQSIMFCSDDKHPNDLLRGHINELVTRAIKEGVELFKVLQAACVNPVKHYNLPVGLLQLGDSADFIEVSDIEDFQVLRTFIKGTCVASNGQPLLEHIEEQPIVCMNCKPIAVDDLKVAAEGTHLRVIQVIPGELITKECTAPAKVESSCVVSDVENDILKLVVVNRYKQAPVAAAFVRGFQLSSGALSSSVAHDSHNIIAVGTNDSDIVTAVNALIESKGGVAVVDSSGVGILPLPIAGLMSVDDGAKTAANYEVLDARAKKLGSKLPAPFMTLSFLALLVIPKLKLSDKGLFDGEAFEFVSLFV